MDCATAAIFLPQDAMAYHESFAKRYMYGHGIVAGLAALLYYATLVGVPTGLPAPPCAG
jgi:hypothetical protein